MERRLAVLSLFLIIHLQYIAANVVNINFAGMMAQDTDKQRINTRSVVYQVDNKPFEGYVATPQELTGKHPALLVVHGWEGVNADTNRRADDMARLGYVALAVDMYGQGVRPETREERGAQAGAVRGNVTLLKQRMDGALAYLWSLPYVRSSAIAAQGYCFGGSVVLQWAFTGAPVRGVVSFHGSLGQLDSTTADLVTANIMIANGQQDTSVPFEDVVRVQTALVEADKTYTLHQYGGARHCFTYVHARGATGNCVYDEQADLRSHAHMEQFYKDLELW
eukprot:TRINITY_DN105099_c0_g1_i1.p1 TRINITY_DN105099_c0_g1~~TRINITY_DN105099_c0_g1_i1.p1  ORF type:complete len:288 (+),score=19.04 TRINITY_DN105099_c0_g1_i1:30-866(+)